MRTKLFEEVPESGITRLWHYDDDTDTATIETIQAVDPLIEINKEIHKAFDERARWKGDGMERVASLPLNVYYDLKAKGILDDQKKFRAWLNDKDNAVFRTRPGRV